MKIKLIKLTAIILSLIGLTSFASLPALAAGETECPDICHCDKVSPDVQAAAGCGNSSQDNLPTIVIGILNAVIGILAVVAVVVIVYGGVQYMTSTGDPGKTKKAKDTILYAAIGLAIAILAAVIVNFVVAAILNGVNSPAE